MNAAIIEKEEFVRRGRNLEYLTILWNSLEGVIAVGAGVAAGSVALVAFGVDSFIELLSGAILLWRLSAGEKREDLALRLVGVSFLILAAYVGFDAIKSLIYREQPEATAVGIVIAVLSLGVMRWLAREKHRVAKGINSAAMAADATQTDICMYLSLILLVGLFLNWAFGWWWADPVAALVMTIIIVKEGVDTVRGKACADCHGH